MFLRKSWHTCRLCNAKIADLADKYQKQYKKKYRSNYNVVFKDHIINDHLITLDEYFKPIYGEKICPCGICNKKVSIKGRNSDFNFKQFACGRNPGILKWSAEAKTTRLGKNNPMFRKKPWNKALTKDTSDILNTISLKMTGRKTSKETKTRQSISAKKRKIHGHTGHKHSEKSKALMRANTLQMIKSGRFAALKSECFIQMGLILDLLKIKYITEHIIDVWAFDYYLIDYNILLEVDGDYFHSNPKMYPNGPKTNTQKINFSRDTKKNDFCKKNNINLIRFWESDILNDREKIICDLKKLLV